MSDKRTEKEWVLWQPVDFLADHFSISPVIPSVQMEKNDTEIVLTPSIDLSILQQQAEQAGFAQGERHGFEQGQQAGYEVGRLQGIAEGKADEITQQTAQRERAEQQIKQLLKNVQEAFDSLDYVVPSRLFQLALTIVYSLLEQRTLSDNLHQSLLERVQRLLSEESLFQHKTQMWVSPEDEPLIAEQFSQTLAERGWSLRADKKMSPGGCRLVCDAGERDESLETRWETLCSLLREECCL